MASSAVAAPGTGVNAAPQSAAVRARPFVQASKHGTEQGKNYSWTPSTATQTFGPDPLPATGYLRRVRLETIASGGGSGTAGVPTSSGDYPASLYNLVRFSEPNGAPIVELTGYNLFLSNCFGGYLGVNDPRGDPDYSATSGGTSNPNYEPFIPVELDSTGMGSLSNLSNASAFRLTLIGEADATIWSTLPNPLPSVAIQVVSDYWTLPNPQDADGNPQATAPPFPGTIQLWSQIQNLTLNQGNNRTSLERMGNQLRTVIMVCRQSGLRKTGTFPSPYTLRWDDINLDVDDPQSLRKKMHEYNNGLQTFAETLGCGFTGVFVFPYNYGVSRFSGANGISSFLPTVTATRYELSGSSATAGTLDWVVNDVSSAPVSGVQRATVGGGLGYYPPQTGGVPGGM